jgi:hypothetical protein
MSDPAGPPTPPQVTPPPDQGPAAMPQPWATELLAAYRRNRLDDQARYYGRRSRLFERARRWTLTTSALLLVLSALFGALASADGSRRAMWAFLAAAFAAGATGVAVYEASSGFERLSRQYQQTLAALRLADAVGPSAADGTDVTPSALGTFVGDVETILLAEVESWSQRVAAEQQSEGSA